MRNKITVRINKEDFIKKLGIKDGISPIIDYNLINQKINDLVKEKIPKKDLIIPIEKEIEGIKDYLKELEDELNKKINNSNKKPQVVSGGINSGSFKFFFKNNIIPIGTVDGSNKVFILPDVPLIGTTRVYADGSRQKITSDYTLSGNTITFISAPTTTVLCDYRI